MTSRLSICLLLLSLGLFAGGATDAQDKKGKLRFANDKYPCTFAGASRVVVEDFDPLDKDAKTASILLDKNQVTHSSFGDPQITTVLYKPVQAKLTLLDTADPIGKGRRIFAVELPKESAKELGKNTLRLVTPIIAKMEPIGIRLLLVSPENKVIQVLDLRS